MGTHVSVTIKTLNGAKLVGVLGGKYTPLGPGGAHVSLPSLLYGQSQDLIVKTTIPQSLEDGAPFVSIALRFDHWRFTQPVEVRTENSQKTGGRPDIHVHRRRLAVAGTISKITSALSDKMTGMLAELTEDLKNGTDPREIALLADVTGQVTEAMNPEYYEKWGQHYLPSLSRAHMLQQCSNFKDPGLQLYGGLLFRKLIKEVEEIFCKLPPPTPSKKTDPTYVEKEEPKIPIKRVIKKPESTYVVRADLTDFFIREWPVFSMSAFCDYGRPCFAGSSSVLMDDGTLRMVQDIKKGDVVRTSSSTSSEVICVLKTLIKEGSIDLVDINGLLITPYHPIYINNSWKFPIDIKNSAKIMCNYIYSFVLQQNSAHTMVINSVMCVTLGHNYVDEVVRHPYFGSQKVVDDLKKMGGWKNGLIEIQHPENSIVRSATTGLICKIIQ